MRYLFSIFTIIFLLILSSCQNQEENDLRYKLSRQGDVHPKAAVRIDAATIEEYQEAEIAINKQYVADIQQILDTDFDEKAKAFEDNELGFFKSYKYMFKVLMDSKKDFQDYWVLKKQQYFTSLTTREKLHNRYLSFSKDIQILRGQISSSVNVNYKTKEVPVNISEENISFAQMVVLKTDHIRSPKTVISVHFFSLT